MTNNLAPAVRFPGSTDDWEQRKLEDLGSFKNGMNFDKSAMGHGHPFINLQNIFGKTVVDDKDLGLAVSSEKQRNEYNLLKGDILFIRSSVKPEGVGEAALVPKNFENTTFSGFIIRFRPHITIDDEFKRVIFATKTVRNQIMALATSSANTNINQISLGKIIIELPELSEQSKIGNLFKQLDNAIALHQRELDNLRATKQGFLKKMFPKEGEMVPEIRFPGFTGNWEQHKLNDLALFNPKSNLPEEFEYVDLESVTGTTMVSHRTETKESAPSRAQRLAVKGDVFYQTVRPYQKNNYLFDLPYDNYVFSTGYAQLRPYGDSYFLLSRLQEERFVLNVLDRCTGTSYPAINSSDLAQIEIHVPLQYEEQVKIGKFFNQLDDTVNLHQQELEKLKQTKQAFLQKMFI